LKHPDDHYYRLDVKYLGFRYHGWQRQPNVKTVQLMVEKTINYVLKGEVKFKIIVASRTDAMVSASFSSIQLIVNKELNELSFILDLNKNLPSDIKALSIKKVSDDFNIITDVISKEYSYQFIFGEKPDPFCAPYMAYFAEDLKFNQMKKASELFIGRHNFESFTEKEKEKDYTREVFDCKLIEVKNNSIPFFPDSFLKLIIRGNGFVKYQIRYIVGALVGIGIGELKENDIVEALKGGGSNITRKAPASGLSLDNITFK